MSVGPRYPRQEAPIRARIAPLHPLTTPVNPSAQSSQRSRIATQNLDTSSLLRQPKIETGETLLARNLDGIEEMSLPQFDQSVHQPASLGLDLPGGLAIERILVP
jgi:hypothetical protein